MAGSMKKLAGQTATYGISSILVRLVNFLLTPYFTHELMSTKQFGVYSDIYSVIPFALVLLTMGLESGYFRFSGKAADKAGKDRVFATTWGAVSLVSVIFMAVILLFKPQIASLAKYSDHQSYVWIVGAIIMFDAMAAIPFARLREQGRAGRYVMIRSASVFINVGICLLFYTVLPRVSSFSLFAEPADPGYAFVANMIASFVTLLLLLPSCDRIAPRIDPKLFRTIFLYSLPLLISGIAGTANEYIDRRMIIGLIPGNEGLSAVGIYSATAKLAGLMMLFTQMYKYAAEPFFLADFKKDDFKTSNAEAMKYYIIFSIFIFLVLTLFKDVVGMILGRDFREGMSLLPVMLISNMLAGIVLNLSFWYKQTGATKFSIIITSVGLVFTVAFNLLLVPKLGYAGAAYARLICETAMVTVSYLLNRKYFPINYDLKRILGYVAIGAAIFLVGKAVNELTLLLKYLVYLLLVTIFVAYSVWREKIDLKGLLAALIKRGK